MIFDIDRITLHALNRNSNIFTERTAYAYVHCRTGTDKTVNTFVEASAFFFPVVRSWCTISLINSSNNMTDDSSPGMCTCVF